MNNDKRTPWYPGEVKPVRVGVYELLSGGAPKEVGYQLWDGHKWGPWRRTAAQAAQTPRGSYADLLYQDDAWRGLSRKP